MSEPPSEEFQRLRRAAFGRDATQADLDALAAASEAPPHADEVTVEPPTLAETSEAEPEPPANAAPATAAPEPVPRRTRYVVILVAAVACSIAIGYGIASVVWSRGESSLRVFEESAGPEDRGSVMFDSINSQIEPRDVPVQLLGDQRLLYEDSEVTVWASLGHENFGESDDLIWTSTVCLAVEFVDGAATGRCSTLDEFNESGVVVPSPVDGDDRVFTWGPTGPLTITQTDG